MTVHVLVLDKTGKEIPHGEDVQMRWIAFSQSCPGGARFNGTVTVSVLTPPSSHPELKMKLFTYSAADFADPDLTVVMLPDRDGEQWASNPIFNVAMKTLFDSFDNGYAQLPEIEHRGATIQGEVAISLIGISDLVSAAIADTFRSNLRAVN